MSNRISIKRFVIPAFIVVLAVLVAFMARTLWNDLQRLSAAGNENAQWTILQLDTEFANLNSLLVEQTAREDPDRDAIRLRTDITLSRIKLVSEGNAADIIGSDESARALLDGILNFAEEAARLIDGELDASAIGRLAELTAETMPIARRLVLRGIQIGAERTEARRHEFADKLRDTGLVAILVLGALAALLVVLDRLLWTAREKDLALRASAKRLESTIANSLDAIVISNSRGKILDFNPAAEKIFDWKKTELAGLTTEILVPELSSSKDGKADDLNVFSKFLDMGRVEIMAQRRTGEVFPADLNVTLAGDRDADDLVIVYLRDISEQKSNEQALVDAKDRAERTDRAKSQFLTIMSHEMRTPLNGVLGVLDLLRTTEPSERQSHYLDVAAASGELLMGQVNEALDIARIETGSLILAPRQFNLEEQLTRVVAVLEPLAKEKGIEISLNVDPAMRMDFISDGNRIGQIVTNLVGNAIKFTSAGSIEITMSGIHTPSDTTANIAVKDTGIGIPADSVEAIFEDFVALSHSSGRMSRSDGLGLSISRKTARLMGGDIKVSSVEGRGSEFTLTLPLKRVSDAEKRLAEKTATPVSCTGSKSRVLIVEDNSINLNVLRDMIEGMGHTVAVAVDGREGFEIALTQAFDLIFMDINMPAMDGIELTKRIREAQGPNRGTRIQGLSAYGEEEYLDQAKAAGMDGFTTKPIRMQQLAQILRDGHISVSGDPFGTDKIDKIILGELRAVLGDARLQSGIEQFFGEMEKALIEMKCADLRGDHENLSAQLHNLRGAAALFGLRTLTEGVAAVRTAAEKEDTGAFTLALMQLERLLHEARKSFPNVKSAENTRQSV